MVQHCNAMHRSATHVMQTLTDFQTPTNQDYASDYDQSRIIHGSDYD